MSRTSISHSSIMTTSLQKIPFLLHRLRLLLRFKRFVCLVFAVGGNMYSCIDKYCFCDGRVLLKRGKALPKGSLPQYQHNWGKIFHRKRRPVHTDALIVVYDRRRKLGDCPFMSVRPSVRTYVKSHLHIQYIIHSMQSSVDVSETKRQKWWQFDNYIN